MLTDASPETVEQCITATSFLHTPSIAFVRDEEPTKAFVMITPSAVEDLLHNHVAVFMQHGFAEGSPFTDLDYANAGVEFVDDLFQLARMTRTLVKYQPFTEDQLQWVRNDQILISTHHANQLSLSHVQALQEKHVSGVALNLIKDLQGRAAVEAILQNTHTPMAASVALSNFMLPILTSFVCSPHLRFALQRNPLLMEATYCYEGKICQEILSERFQLPVYNIITLCWDLN